MHGKVKTDTKNSIGPILYKSFKFYKDMCSFDVHNVDLGSGYTSDKSCREKLCPT